MITTETLRSQRELESIEKGYTIKHFPSLCAFASLCFNPFKELNTETQRHKDSKKNIVSMFSDFLCDLSVSVVYFCPELVDVSGEA